MYSRMEHVNMSKRGINDTKKIQIKLLHIRDTAFEIKSALDRSNSRSYTGCV